MFDVRAIPRPFRAAALACALCLSVGSTFAGYDRSCLQFPPGMELEPGELFRLGDSGFVLQAGFVPDRWDPEAGDGTDAPAAAAPGTLVLDLFAGYLDGRTGTPRRGTLMRGLEIGFTLSGPSGTLARGDLSPRLTSTGPTYGAEVELDGSATSLTLALDIADTGDDVARPEHDEPGIDHDEGECPRVPATLRFGFDVEETVAAWSSGEVAPDAPGDDRNMTLVGSLDPRTSNDYNDIWGYDDGTTFLAILGTSGGTSFVDVTDPGNPVEVGFIAGPTSSWRDMKTLGSYAYIVTEGSGSGTGMQIVDLSDPSNPTLVNTYDSDFTTAHNIWIDVGAGLAYVVGTSSGTHILDIATDPVNPTPVDVWNDRYVHDAYVADGWAYFSEINNGLHEILDASDPAAGLTVTASWETPQADSHNSWANADQTVVACTDETSGGSFTSVYDIASKSGPNPLLSTYEPDPNAIVHNVMFDDDDNALLAMSHYALGIKVVDLHRPSRPVEWGSYDTYPSGDGGFNGAWGVYAFDPRGYYYISDIQTGLYVFELDPAGGTLSGVVRDASSLEPIGGARVLDLSDGGVTTTAADGVYAVYAEGEAALRVDAWGYRSAVVRPGEVPPGGRLDADLELERLPRVALTGTVTAEGLPVPGLRVEIVGSDRVATTAADGSYAFPDIAIGQQTIVVGGFGYASTEGRVVLRRGESGILDLEVVPAAFADDVEADAGWTAGIPGDGATSGIWERGEPNPTGGGQVQPGVDATPDPGTDAYVTGNQPNAGVEEDDVEGGDTTLLSPTIDASALAAAVVRYQRWVSTAGGALAGGLVRVQLSPDDGANWTTLETQTANANAWTSRSFDVGTRTAITDTLRLRVVASPTTSFQNFRVLEAAIDDVEIVDGCGARFNPEASDADADGRVDACDPCPDDPADDGDADGVCGDADNAPDVANAGQEDADGDGVGDVVDNCPSDANAAQFDADRDGIGDACDDDIDGDGETNDVDPDDDGDGIDDAADVCPTVPDGTQPDRDGDGEGDACDADDGEVHALTLNGNRLRWAPESDAEAYHVYRGDLGAAALLPLAACRVASLGVTTYVDGDLPRPGDGFSYLATRIAGGVEGSLGRDSTGAERVVDEPCP